MMRWTSTGAITSSGKFLFLLLLLCFLSSCTEKRPLFLFGGGPPGSTFQNFAVELGALLNQEMPDIQVDVKPSSGSVHNLIQIDRAKLTMALVSSEDAQRGQAGELPKHQTSTENVVALVRLFGSAAQLVVPASSPIRTPYDLRRNRVAIGTHGSGSALSAERFFRGMGIWEEITPIYASATMSLAELSQWGVEAVWLLAGFPSQALQETNQTFPIRLIDLTEVAVKSGFFISYPSYTLARIPSATYKGQDLDIFTFQNSILWVANREIDEEFVYRSLKFLFSDRGLTQIHFALPSAWDLDVKKGLRGVKIPLHPGAVRFLKEAWFPPNSLLSDPGVDLQPKSLAALVKPDTRLKTEKGD